MEEGLSDIIIMHNYKQLLIASGVKSVAIPQQQDGCKGNTDKSGAFFKKNKN